MRAGRPLIRHEPDRTIPTAGSCSPLGRSTSLRLLRASFPRICGPTNRTSPESTTYCTCKQGPRSRAAVHRLGIGNHRLAAAVRSKRLVLDVALDGWQSKDEPDAGSKTHLDLTRQRGR
jgi:hypothetical protein